MNKDFARLDQPEGSYRDALNANIDFQMGSVVSEEGNTFVPISNADVIGSIALPNDEILVFGIIPYTDPDDDTVTEISAIVLSQPKLGLSFPILIHKDLNFQRNNPIVAEQRLDAKNDLIVYFTDNYSKISTEVVETDWISEFNPPRTFNITRQLQANENFPETRIYGNSNFTIDKLNLFPVVGTHSEVRRADVKTGGAVVAGAYHLALCYSDEDFLETNYFTVTPPVYIISEPENSVPIDSVIGTMSGSSTNKSITWIVKIPSTVNYKFLQASIIQRVGNAENVYKLERVALGGDGKDQEITYTGREDASTNSVEDIVLDKVNYLTAKTLTQLDDRLLLANLKSRKDIGYQRYANNITVEPVVKELEGFDARVYDIVTLNKGYGNMVMRWDAASSISDLSGLSSSKLNPGGFGGVGQSFLISERDPDGSDGIGPTAVTSGTDTSGATDVPYKLSPNYISAVDYFLRYKFTENNAFDFGANNPSYSTRSITRKGYKDYRLNYRFKSFKRGDVYALYLSFVLKDGTETYAYHIPGRHALTIRPLDVDCGGAGSVWNIKENSTFKTQGSEDYGNTIAYQQMRSSGLSPEEVVEKDPEGKIYQYVDTSYHETDTDFNLCNISTNNMGYWENVNELYPISNDFLAAAVDEFGVSSFDGEGIIDENVRHHRMPSNLNPDFSYIKYQDPSSAGPDVINETYGPVGSEKSTITKILVGDKFSNGFGSSTTSVETYSQLASSHKSGNAKSLRKIITHETARLLGIKLSNIQIPKHILKEVQGYKIYYAKRKEEDKLIAGQSLAVPMQPKYAAVNTQNRLLARKGPYQNAFYAYGGIRSDLENALAVAAPWRTTVMQSDVFQGNRYYASPAFTFHDFNMLRKKPSLDTITHTQCIAGISFRHFLGGPGVFGKYSEDYTDSSGSKEVDKVMTFPSLGWIHPDLGNTTDFNEDGQIYNVEDILIEKNEDVNRPYGDDDSPDAGASDDPENYSGARKFFRKLIGKSNDPDDVAQLDDLSERNARRYRIRSFYTGVYIAAGYYSPKDVIKFSEIIVGGANRIAPRQEWDTSLANLDNDSFITNNQFLFMFESGSKKYLPGLRNLKIAESASFLGAQYIYNRGGESSIALGLVSGLPHLRGVQPRFEVYDVPGVPWSGSPNSSGEFGGPVGGPYGIVTWSDDNQFLYPDAHKTGTGIQQRREIPDYFTSSEGLNNDSAKFRGMNFSLTGKSHHNGYPMAWLVNVCTAKTDVYQPFDRQELVWTGYYHPIDADLDTGQDTSISATVSNYYTGAESENVFGGDTYITKYAFRTTSQSYGHCHFRASKLLGDNVNLDGLDASTLLFPNLTTAEGKKTTQKDLPDFFDPFGSMLGTGSGQSIWWPAAFGVGGDQYPDISSKGILKGFSQILHDTGNWVQGNSDPVASLFTFFVESDDNIGFRHSLDSEKGVESKFFDYNCAADVLFDPPTNDHTKMDNLLYEDHYSALQDKKVTIPFPKLRAGVEDVDTFNTRVIRSKIAGLSKSDRYREFLANDFADVPKNKGEINHLFSTAGTLYIHTDKTIFQTKGKEEMSLGTVQAFIGSGDIFAIPPSELQEAEIGYGGTSSELSSVSTHLGHFYLSRRDRRVHMFTGAITEIMGGMDSWLRNNIPYEIETYGINVDADDFAYNPDSPVNSVPFGFTAAYDPKYDRILLTKKERVPTEFFIEQWNKGVISLVGNMFISSEDCENSLYKQWKALPNTSVENMLAGNSSFNSKDENDYSGPPTIMKEIRDDSTHPRNTGHVWCGPIGLENDKYFRTVGWTISYYPKLQMWGSRHSYIPKLYVSSQQSMYSFFEQGLYKHGDEANPGLFYGTLYSFEFEFIDNVDPSVAKLYSTLFYLAEAKKRDSKARMISGTNTSEFLKQTFPIFSEFYVYNSTQVSGENTNISYLHNCRLVDRTWYVNSFRDLSKTAVVNNPYIVTGSTSIINKPVTGLETTLEDVGMFIEEGVINPNYVDADKIWHTKRKFVDHFLGVRLISDNSSKNLIHLYAAGTKYRKSNR